MDNHLKHTLTLIFLMITTISAFSQSTTCIESELLCTDNGISYPASYDAPSADPMHNYGCLTTQFNPTWFHMLIETSGELNIEISGAGDIDFVCWGPFDDPFEPCESPLSGDMIVDCSYSPQSTEVCDIDSTQTGEYYILLVTNFENSSFNIYFSQIGGDGVLSCSDAPVQIFSNSPVCEGDSLFLSAHSIEEAEFYWQGPNGFESNEQHLEFANVAEEHEGLYELIAYFEGEESDTATLEVEVNPTPVVSAGEDKTIPFGTSVELEGSVEGAGYSYTWTPAELLVYPDMLTPTTVNLEESAEFTFRATKYNTGCYSEDQTLVTVTGSPLGVNVSSDFSEICSGEQIQLQALTSGGSGEYTYNWSSEPEGFSSDIYNPVAMPEQSITYMVDVSDGFTTVSGQVTVEVKDSPEVFAGEDKTIPHGTSTMLESVTTGGDGNYVYDWSNAAYLHDDDIANPRTTNLYEPITFSLEVTDGNGCVSNTDEVAVSLSGEPLTAAAESEDEDICKGQETTLHASAVGGSEEYSFSWSLNGDIFATTRDVTVAPSATTTYKLTVDDGYNEDVKSVAVAVSPVPEVNIVPEGYSAEDDTLLTCVTDTLYLDASTDVQATYLWDDGFTEAVKDVYTDESSYEIQTHQVAVTDLQNGCVAEQSLTIVFTKNQCTSVEELALKGISVYPVPASKYLVVQLDGHPGKTTLTLSSVQGELLARKEVIAEADGEHRQTFDVSHLKPGLYVITIKNELIHSSVKVIVK